jgi:hypothetical protein
MSLRHPEEDRVIRRLHSLLDDLHAAVCVDCCFRHNLKEQVFRDVV